MIIRLPSLGAAKHTAFAGVLEPCFGSIARPNQRQFATLRSSRTNVRNAAQRLKSGYFSNNTWLPKNEIISKGRASTSTSFTSRIPAIPKEDPVPVPLTATIPEELPHRKRQREKREAEAAAASDPQEPVLTHDDAASILTTQSEAAAKNSMKRLFSTLLALSKPRLSFLIVLTRSEERRVGKECPV